MAEDRVCPTTSAGQCGDNFKTYCQNDGLCCLDSPDKPFCRCFNGWGGLYCHLRDILESKQRLEKMQTIAVFSALLGVLVIALFVAVIVLQVKYYRNRMKRRLDNHEMDKVPKKDSSREDSDHRKLLRLQPGYSWRESVRQTPKTLLSRSVPDLFKIGMTMAMFGVGDSKGLQTLIPNQRHLDSPGHGKDGRPSNLDSTDLSTSCGPRTHSEGNDGGKMVHVEIEEDTVG